MLYSEWSGVCVHVCEEGFSLKGKYRVRPPSFLIDVLVEQIGAPSRAPRHCYCYLGHPAGGGVTTIVQLVLARFPVKAWLVGLRGRRKVRPGEETFPAYLIRTHVARLTALLSLPSRLLVSRTSCGRWTGYKKYEALGS